jgi:hypothetical protein
VKVQIAAALPGGSERCGLDINPFRSRCLISVYLIWAARYVVGFAVAGIEAINRLLHQGPALPNAPVDLLGQNLEALVAQNDRLALSRIGNRRHDGEMISGVQRDGFGDRPQIALEVVEPGVHTFKTLTQQSIDRWGGAQKMLKGGFHEHALADARSVGCGVKPTADAFTKPNRYFAARGGFAPARRSNVNAIGLRIQSGLLLHLLIFPKTPRPRPRLRDTMDEVN